MDEPRVYRVIVVAPNGDRASVLIPEEQVALFKGDTGGPFATAAWLGYTHLWTREV